MALTVQTVCNLKKKNQPNDAEEILETGQMTFQIWQLSSVEIDAAWGAPDDAYQTHLCNDEKNDVVVVFASSFQSWLPDQQHVCPSMSMVALIAFHHSPLFVSFATLNVTVYSSYLNDNGGGGVDFMHSCYEYQTQVLHV